jgi:hypothetical protein
MLGYYHSRHDAFSCTVTSLVKQPLMEVAASTLQHPYNVKSQTNHSVVLVVVVMKDRSCVTVCSARAKGKGYNQP